jgi:enoyl-CoA hydratase
MSDGLLSYSQDGDIATVIMDDGKANALSSEMLQALGAAFDQAEAKANALVLAGREGKFSAGFDLRTMMAGPDAARGLVSEGAELMMRAYQLPMPLVIACTGHALAGGALLCATGDTRIGARGAFKIGLNEVQVGIPVPVLAHELARDRLLPTELVASVVQAKIYDPDSAAAAGWLDRVVEPDQVLAEAQAEAERLARLPRRPYAVSKKSLRRQTVEYVLGTLEANMAELLPSPQ